MIGTEHPHNNELCMWKALDTVCLQKERKQKLVKKLSIFITWMHAMCSIHIGHIGY